MVEVAQGLGDVHQALQIGRGQALGRLHQQLGLVQLGGHGEAGRQPLGGEVQLLGGGQEHEHAQGLSPEEAACPGRCVVGR